MAYYELRISRRAQKELRSIGSARDRDSIVSAARNLSSDPRPNGCKKLQGRENQWRIRVGNFHIIYSIYDKELVVQVIQIVNRRDAY